MGLDVAVWLEKERKGKEQKRQRHRKQKLPSYRVYKPHRYGTQTQNKQASLTYMYVATDIENTQNKLIK